MVNNGGRKQETGGKQLTVIARTTRDEEDVAPAEHRPEGDNP